jgi:hypothetical protein
MSAAWIRNSNRVKFMKILKILAVALAIPLTANACPNIENGSGMLTNGSDVWTFGPAYGSGWELFIDGTWAGGGLGTEIEIVNGQVYTLGTDGNFWSWTTGRYWATTGTSSDPCPSQKSYMLLHGS